MTARDGPNPSHSPDADNRHRTRDRPGSHNEAPRGHQCNLAARAAPLLFADDKATLQGWLPEVERRLARLRLTLHPGAHPRPVTEGIPFLGFLVFPEHRRLKRRKGIAFVRRLRVLAARCAAGEIALDQVHASVRGWINHVRYANTIGLRKGVLGRNPIHPAMPKATA